MIILGAISHYPDGMLLRVGGVFGLILLVFWLFTIFDSLTTPAERVRTMPKGIWVLIVLLLSALGGLLWLIFGRPYPITAGSARVGARTVAPQNRTRGGRPTPRRAIAPDDDLDFLRSLDRDLKRDGDSDDGDSGSALR